MQEQDKTDFHLFETNHPYFIELGLGSFTTGTLLSWWNERDALGRYLNRRHINIPNGLTDTLFEPENGLQELLGITDETEFYWNGWKPNLEVANAGRFKKQNLKGLGSNQGGEDNDIWDFAGATTAGITNVQDTIDRFNFAEENPVIGVTISGDFSQETNGTGIPVFASAGDPWSPPNSPIDPADSGALVSGNQSVSGWFNPVKQLDPLYSLIQLNKFMTHYDDYFPRSTWDVNDDSTHAPMDKKEAFGSYALLNEIKAGKGSPRIQWSGDVTFFINQNNGLIDNCEITENITFKLFLLDESMSPGLGKGVTVKNMTFVGPRRDAAGASPGEDGERVSDDPEDVTGQAAGEVDLQWNPVTKRWQSGNVNMLCKLVTQLRPGKAPSLDYLLNNDIKETLEEEDNANSYIPSRGSGMLIRTQNSMPLQWSPNYAETADTRCSTNNRDKQIVTVYNFNPRRTYPSGEEVLLTQIDGVWHVSDLGRGEEEEEPGAVSAGIGKWDSFTYMMTSSQFFFRAQDVESGSGVAVTPRSAELNYHVNYYLSQQTISSSLPDADQALEDAELNLFVKYDNPGDELTGRKPQGGYNFSQPFNTKNWSRWKDERGYLQNTSFDYLDSQIFGIRGKEGVIDGEGGKRSMPDTCGIASTSATLNAAGKTIPFAAEEYPYRNAAHCGAFFGCVFPNGFQGTEVYDIEEPRNFLIGSASKYGSVNPEDYLIVSNDSTSNNPFDAGNRTSDRNDCNTKCFSTTNPQGNPQPFADINIGNNVPDNLHTRATYSHSANLFALGADQGRRTIPADVMMNGSPTARHGAPIRPIGRLNGMNIDDIEAGGAELLLLNHQRASEGIWLRKVSQLGPNVDENDSAFDFQPITRDNVMFRPLKLEAYLMQGRLAVDLHNNPTSRRWDERNTIANQQTGGFYRYTSDPRAFFTEMASTTVSNYFPISCHVNAREFENTKNNLAGWERGNAAVGNVLKWGAWGKSRPSYSRLHLYNYWQGDNDDGGMWWTTSFLNLGDPFRFSILEQDATQDWKGAGAFGIITCSLKVAANTSIEFVTSNLYGMGAAAAGQFTVQSGNAEQNKTWGVSNFIESYKQENIVDLSVRIYQGHPTDQTIYDPRYFAVHHFNQGLEFAFDLYQGTGVIPVNDLSVDSGNSFPRNFLFDEFKNLRDSEGDLLESVTYVFPEQSGVDIPIPSRWEKHIDSSVNSLIYGQHENNKVYRPQSLNSFDRIFKDATKGLLGLAPPIMKEQYWNTSTKRTGKLLPYRYKLPTLGIPVSQSADNVNMIAESLILDSEDKTVYSYSDDLIVTDFGTGFVSGDAVGDLESDIVLEVREVGPNGEVVSLFPILFGTGIPVSKVRASGDQIGSFTSTFTMFPLTGNGQGFRGYFVSAGLQNIITTDDKPFLIKKNGEEISRIAANEPGPKHLTTGFSSAAEPLAFIENTETTTFAIPEILKSEDGVYDLFFHFHNDVTFNWLACRGKLDNGAWGDFNNGTEANEQHVTIESISLT
jgi:hypothetical protein